MFPTKAPWVLKKIYPSLIWEIQSTEKNIYLTFDDGPIPEVTLWVLDTLKKFDAKATFFCIGDNVKKNPEIFQKIIEQGHTIGNHTFNHLNGWKTSKQSYLQNFYLGNQYTNSNFFRPPYGKISRQQMREIKQQNPKIKIVMWSVLTKDVDATQSSQDCLQKTLKNTKSGSIVVFHDSIKAFPVLQKVLPQVLEVWQKEGYNFKNLQSALG